MNLIRSFKAATVCMAVLLGAIISSGQIYVPGYYQSMVSPRWLIGYWSAKWVQAADNRPNEYGVYMFRKQLDLISKPDRFVVHVSADNRYKFYVNDSLVCLGPLRGDYQNWNYETVDLAPYLHSGKNQLAAVVWSYADMKPAAQISAGGGAFLVQGDGETEQCANTDESWRAVRNDAYSPNYSGPVRGYYVAGPLERIDVSKYPQAWTSLAFDDSSWSKARGEHSAGAKGSRDHWGRQLVPRRLPAMEMRPSRFAAVRSSSGVDAAADFIAGNKPLVIPAGSHAEILLDYGVETNGYLTVDLSGGKGAELTIAYAENMFDRDDKGNVAPSIMRDDIDGKVFIGYEDRILADGRDNFRYTPLWWRTWRYVRLSVETNDAPLVIDDIYNVATAYPFELAASFKAPGDKALERMFDVGWRTARCCAVETYMDCPYYEQLQYFGDTRIQTMVSMYNTADTPMVRSAIEAGREAMLPQGLLYSRYPTSVSQVISSYSLSWTGMVYDYWMYRGDEDYVRTLLPAVRSVMWWFRNFIKDDGSLAFIPYWYFCDWAPQFSNGEAPRDENGDSAIQDLNYIIALDEAAAMEEALGMPAIAEDYRAIANTIRSGFDSKYWDSQRRLYADTRSHGSFSQHANLLAVLAGMVEGDEAKELCNKILTDKSLTQVTIYFRYFLNQALRRAGLGNKYLDELDIWRTQLDQGCTVWAERPAPSRSECHAWGASPNVELFRTVLGIDASSPGFRTVYIKPALGYLKEASGTMPHPAGSITVDYKLDRKGNIRGTVTLPDGVSGVFEDGNRQIKLKGGVNRL